MPTTARCEPGVRSVGKSKKFTHAHRVCRCSDGTDFRIPQTKRKTINTLRRTKLNDADFKQVLNRGSRDFEHDDEGVDVTMC